MKTSAAPSKSSWREIWRIPLPEGARVSLNRGPQPRSRGWRHSGDGRWLILDTPIPGLCDVEQQGTWEAHYTLPARQTFVQTYPMPFPIEEQQVTAWGVDGDMSLLSEQLGASDSGMFPDPLNGTPARLRLLFNPARHLEVYLFACYDHYEHPGTRRV